ncbi:MAG: transposase [Cyclobacteriaceae bacterium]
MVRLEPCKYYHIYNRGNNGEKLFFEEENYRFFLSKFKAYLKDHVEVYAYCLMPNHFHFFIQVREKLAENANTSTKLTPTEKAFRDFFISYAKAINKKYNRTGSLFQYKFKRKEIADDAYFSWLIFYIHHNPIAANLAKSTDSWPFSSYKAIISKADTSVNKAQVLEWFGGKDAFIQFHVINLESNSKMLCKASQNFAS